MKLPAYPKYKPSGVEWLGEVPEGWEVKRSDRFVVTTKHQVEPESFEGLEVLHYSIPNVQKWNSAIVEKGDDIASAKQLVNEPTVLVSKLNPRKATIIMAEPHEEFLTLASTEFVAIRPTTRDLRFLAYLVSSEWFRQKLDSTVQSVTRSHQRARPEDIFRFWAAWPKPPEQTAIADFLDRETGKIDTLVAKNRTLIERLKEKRSALISRTVTRGLPPDAARAAGLDPHPRLKPSGVEWLGDVPAHWQIPPLYARYSVELGKMLDAKRISGQHLLPYLRNVDVQWDSVNVEGLPEMDINTEEYGRYTLEKGDLLVCEGGEVGRTAIWREELRRCAFQKALHRVRPHSGRDLPRFFYYVMRAAASTGVFLAHGNPNTIPHLTAEKLRVYRLAFPPPEEQRAIVNFLDGATTKIDTLIAKIETTIERLQEYRAALITAAVTGKSDVRGVAK